jgi:DNA-binding IclR family transcriptional regulator
MRPPEAACLEVLRSGTERQMLIGLRAGLNVQQTRTALGRLASTGLAVANGHRTWRVTPRGKAAKVAINTARTRGRPPGPSLVPGTAAARLLALLDRPRHGAELPALLGVTRQRVNQLIVALSADGLIRSADPDHPTWTIVLRDDPSLLLPKDQGRVLSAFPDVEETTLLQLARVTGLSAVRTARIAGSLRRAGLVEKSWDVMSGDLYRLTVAGASHWQRSVTARQAALPALPFRSDRILDVLSHLAFEGPARMRDIGHSLGIPEPSIKALMRCLKHKKAVCPQGRCGTRQPPYEVTPDGQAMLVAMLRRTGDAAPA